MYVYNDKKQQNNGMGDQVKVKTCTKRRLSFNNVYDYFHVCQRPVSLPTYLGLICVSLSDNRFTWRYFYYSKRSLALPQDGPTLAQTEHVSAMSVSFYWKNIEHSYNVMKFHQGQISEFSAFPFSFQ